MSIKGPDKARAVVGGKGLEDFIPHTLMTHGKPTFGRNSKRRSNAKRDLLLRHRSHKHSKAADRAPDEECTRPKPLRVRKTVQNRRIDLSATDLDRRNRRRRHISGEVSPRQRCHCSSILVSPRKDMGAVTAEYTGY